MRKKSKAPRKTLENRPAPSRLSDDDGVERADGIEPTIPLWKRGVLPLNYARKAHRELSRAGHTGQARFRDNAVSAPPPSAEETGRQGIPLPQATGEKLRKRERPWPICLTGQSADEVGRSGGLPFVRQNRDAVHVNLILFERHETALPLPHSDRRALHLREVLRRQPGDTFDAGLVDGPMGKGKLVAATQEGLRLSFAWTDEPPPLPPITLIIGLPRPQTARKILQEATALGISQLHFVTTEKGEPNYASSTLWLEGEWRRHLLAGAEQAFCTRLPEISHGKPLAEMLTAISPTGIRVALDNYESPSRLSELRFDGAPVVLALGAERGWSTAERELLRRQNFSFAHLGRRVLRVETACLAALAIVRALSGFA